MNRAISVLTLLNIVAALLGVANSVLVAHLFGTGLEVEAFFAASTVVAMVMSLAQAGQLSELVLPTYHRIRHEEGAAHASAAFSVILNWTTAAAAGLALIIGGLAPWIIRILVPGFTPTQQVLGTSMFRWLAPLLVIQVALTLIRTLANAERRFGRPEAVGVVSHAASLGVIAVLSSWIGAWSLVASMWAAQAVQLVGLLVILRKMGYRHTWRMRLNGFSTREVFGQLGFTSSYVGATQLYTVGLNAGVSLLPQGVYAVFKYVQQLFARTNGVFLRPISTVFFTRISESLAANAAAARTLVQRALSSTLAVWSMLMVAVLAGGRPLLAALWGSDRFAEGYIDLAYRLLTVFYGMLAVSGLNQLQRRSAIAAGGVRLQYLGATAVQLASAAIAWFLIPKVGLAGVYVTLLFNVIGLTMVSVLVVFRRKPELASFYPWASIWRWTIAAGIALAVAWPLMNFQNALSQARWAQLGWGIFLSLVAMSITGLVARWLRVPELVSATSWFRRSLRRTRGNVDAGAELRPDGAVSSALDQNGSPIISVGDR